MYDLIYNSMIIMDIRFMYIQTPFHGNQSSYVHSEKAVSYYNMGCTMQEQGKITDAVRLYKEALKLDPKHVDAHYNLGSAFQVSEQMNVLKSVFCSCFMSVGVKIA